MTVAKFKGKWHIPLPSGPHVVGSVDILTPGSTKEGTFARLYYPADGKNHYERHDAWSQWIDYECIRGLCTVTSLPLPVVVLEKILNWMWGSVHIPAVVEAIPIKKPHPFVMLSHGLGANRTMYSQIAIDLASHGFFVMNIEHRENSACASYAASESGEVELVPHNPLPHGSEIDYPVRVQQLEDRFHEVSRGLDLAYRLNNGERVDNVLDRQGRFDLKSFKGLIDLDKPALMGHSFGGATVLVGLAKDPRFKIGALLDPWLFGLRETISSLPQEITQPMITINMEAFLTQSSLSHLKSFLSSQSGVDRVMCTIKGTVHYNQTDVPLATPWYLRRLAGAHSDLDTLVAKELNITMLRLFLCRQLGLTVPDECSSLLEEHDVHIDKISWFSSSQSSESAKL